MGLFHMAKLSSLRHRGSPFSQRLYCYCLPMSRPWSGYTQVFFALVQPSSYLRNGKTTPQAPGPEMLPSCSVPSYHLRSMSISQVKPLLSWGLLLCRLLVSSAPFRVASDSCRSYLDSCL